MTLSHEQWLLLALMAAGWLYYSDKTSVATPLAPAITGSNGGATVSTDSTVSQNYGLPGWHDLASQFKTGD